MTKRELERRVLDAAKRWFRNWSRHSEPPEATAGFTDGEVPLWNALQLLHDHEQKTRRRRS